MATKKNEQRYDIYDFQGTGTLEQLAKALSRLSFEVSTADDKTIDDNNDDDQPFYDDGVVSCVLTPMA